jgi:hypothetical protein
MPTFIYVHKGIWSALKFVNNMCLIIRYVHTQFGMEDGTVLFHSQIRICTYAHPVNYSSSYTRIYPFRAPEVCFCKLLNMIF